MHKAAILTHWIVLETLTPDRHSFEKGCLILLNNSFLQPYWKSISGTYICQSPGPSGTTHMSPTRKLVNLGLTSIHGAHCLDPVNNFQAHKQDNQSYQGWREVTSRHDSPPNADIHFAPERGGWGSLQRRHVSALLPAPSFVGQAATLRAGTGCGCGHQRRTLEPLANQRQGMGVQLIKLSWRKCARIWQRGLGRFKRPLM